MPVRVDKLCEQLVQHRKAELSPRSYSIQGLSGRFTNRNRTDYLQTPESNIYRRQGEEDNDQYPQNDPDPHMNDSALDQVLLVIAQWKQYSSGMQRLSCNAQEHINLFKNIKFRTH